MKKQVLIDDINKTTLIESAFRALSFSYSPYSKFRVGCAVLLNDGNIIVGTNIENASYPVTLCAERSAMASIVSQGQQRAVVALAVVTEAKPLGTPCGMCRQFLSELLEIDTPIILANSFDESAITSMRELLPHPFDQRALLGN